MREECLICGAPLEYLENDVEMECSICHKKTGSKTRCVNGHFVCDECHTKGVDAVIGLCLTEKSKDPVEIIEKMMAQPFCHMHGPEHHIMVGAALLTAYVNAGGKIMSGKSADNRAKEDAAGNSAGDRAPKDEAGESRAGEKAKDKELKEEELKEALGEMVRRGKSVPGGACGFWGACGAGISAGMFVSIISGSTPLKNEAFGLSNRMTSAALGKIGDVGGPRCCKRDSFLSIQAAVDFVRENLGVEMEKADVTCRYSGQNEQCIGIRCPYSAKVK